MNSITATKPGSAATRLVGRGEPPDAEASDSAGQVYDVGSATDATLELATLTARVDAQADSLTDLDDVQVPNIQGQLDSLSLSVLANEEDIAGIQVTVTGVEGDVDNLLDSISSVSVRIDDLVVVTDDLGVSITAANARTDLQATSLTALEEDVASLTTTPQIRLQR